MKKIDKRYIWSLLIFLFVASWLLLNSPLMYGD